MREFMSEAADEAPLHPNAKIIAMIGHEMPFEVLARMALCAATELQAAADEFTEAFTKVPSSWEDARKSKLHRNKCFVCMPICLSCAHL